MRVSAGAAWLAGLAAVAVFSLTLSPLHAGNRKQQALQELEPSWRYSDADRNHHSTDTAPPGTRNKRAAATTAAAGDTTVLGSWTFGPGCSSAGWTSVDRSEQAGTFFHVDDFAGLGGGSFGRLVPLEGTQSLWCGVRPGQTHPSLCGYATPPGYGDSWDQLVLTADCLDVTGDVSVDYMIAWDTEPNYDYAVLEYSECDETWLAFEGGPGVFDGVGSALVSSTVGSDNHSGNVKLRFRFMSDALWSDRDGNIDTDGAVILDSLTVRDDSGIVLATERFEIEGVGATATISGNWIAGTHSGFGDFAGTFDGYNLVQQDDCVYNPSCAWGFFAGSTADYSCGGFPEQPTVPYSNVRRQYIWNEIWSPWIPLTGTGERLELAFDVYRDLPLDALVFYVWHVRTRDVDGCPGVWRDRNFAFFGADRAWLRQTEDVADLIEPGATELQVALGVRDLCKEWCGFYGSGECHTHSPLFDNVELRRVDTTGPQWSVRDVDLFQDTFSSDGTTTGTARIDAAVDLLSASNPNVRPGDSTAVTVYDVEHGLATDAWTGSGASIYAHVSVWNGIDPYSGHQIVDDSSRWPLVDSLLHRGRTWYRVRMDTVFADAAPVANRFCVDLNDNLFVPGDTVFFVFSATSAAPSGATTWWTPFTGATLTMTDALDAPDEYTVLPASGWQRGGEVLYVDGFNGRGAQPFFDTAFRSTGMYTGVDRYDIRGPGSRSGNHPGARVVDVSTQLLPGYRVIIWNTGDLERGLIGDGTIYNEKSNDAAMLVQFLDGLSQNGGVFLSGDNIAEEWTALTGSAHTLRDTYIQHTLVDGNHADVGFGNWPLLVGVPGGPFVHTSGPDTTYGFDACPGLREFDVLSPGVGAAALMSYDGGAESAVVGQLTTNPLGRTVGVVLAGVGFDAIRDDRVPRVGQGMDRFDFLRDVMVWFGVVMPAVTDASGTFRSHLAQNVPNPFNPSTSIEFTVRERAPVSLRIYNVRGQLVKTLVEGTRAPGRIHRVDWDGRNEDGGSVASGVYFYRLVTTDFARTRKMVLLK